jgi:hypothetical protein
MVAKLSHPVVPVMLVCTRQANWRAGMSEAEPDRRLMVIHDEDGLARVIKVAGDGITLSEGEERVLTPLLHPQAAEYWAQRLHQKHGWPIIQESPNGARSLPKSQ